MANVKDLSIEELEQLIEQKIYEILGDPDAGLELNEKFKQKLIERLGKQSERVSHHEVLSRFGKD